MIRLFVVLSCCGSACVAASCCFAQTSVQLPTFENFRVSTTVLVPDRGTAHLGGIARAQRSRHRAGIPVGGPLWGARQEAAHAAGNVSIGATIIDHGEWDRRLLAAGEHHGLDARPIRAAGGPASVRNEQPAANNLSAATARRAVIMHRWRHLADAAGVR